MKIKKGDNRIVIILTTLGIVIKFARFRLKNISSNFKHTSIQKTIVRELEYTYRTYWSLRWRLTKGIIDNWNEYRFYQQHKMSCCTPTFFSFFGLFNLQKLGEPLPKDLDGIRDLWSQLSKLTNGDIIKDSHAFNNTDNFCQKKGKLQMVDYGSVATQEVLIEYGHLIYDKFDISLRNKKK